MHRRPSAIFPRPCFKSSKDLHLCYHCGRRWPLRSIMKVENNKLKLTGTKTYVLECGAIYHPTRQTPRLPRLRCGGWAPSSGWDNVRVIVWLLVGKYPSSCTCTSCEFLHTWCSLSANTQASCTRTSSTRLRHKRLPLLPDIAPLHTTTRQIFTSRSPGPTLSLPVFEVPSPPSFCSLRTCLHVTPLPLFMCSAPVLNCRSPSS